MRIISLKMGVKFAASLSMGKNIQYWYAFFFFLPKASFKMGTFSDPQHIHILAFLYWSRPPPGGGGDLLNAILPGLKGCTHRATGASRL